METVSELCESIVSTIRDINEGSEDSDDGNGED